MSGLVKTVATTSEPVTRAQAQLYARYEEGEIEDDMFDTFIIVGREQVEAITEHQLNTATFVQYFDSWQRCFLLSKPPLQSITSVQYTDADGATQTVSSNDYAANIFDQHRGNVRFNFDFNFPVLNIDQMNSIQITFIAGYEGWPVALPAGVPKTLTHAIKLFVNDVWSHREFELDGKVTGNIQNNKVAMQILNSYRVNTPTAIGIGSSIPQSIR